METAGEPTIAGDDPESAPRDRGERRTLRREGERIGRYTVLQLLGKGGMGLVYGAYDPELDRRVAVKVLRGEQRRSKATIARQRLVREAQAMAKLSHPNVVAVHDVGTVDDEVFVAMEFVDGTDLDGWLRARTRTVPEIVKVFAQAGRGLAAAHAAGMVHRDFKPANVLIDRKGRAKVTDFGLVRTHGGPLEIPTDPISGAEPQTINSLTDGAAMIGTPAFMAPEQHAREDVDARTDQFGFCVSLYRALYGEHPFGGESLPELVSAVTRGARKDPPARNDVPSAVRRVVMRGLERDPMLRWPSMETLLDALLVDPAKRRLRWILGTAGVLALGGIVALAVRPRPEPAAPAPPCEGADAEMDAIWSADRDDAIARAFATTGEPHAPALWSRSAAIIGDYEERWRRSARDACEATRVRGEQSDLMFDLRRECLGRRLDELHARLDLLETADSSILDHSFALAGSLTPIDVCEDTERLRQTVPPPDDPDRAKRAEILRSQIESLRVQSIAGRDAEIVDEAEALVTRAAELDYAPLAGEARLLAAEVHIDLGHWDRAALLFELAARDAAEGHDDQLLARIWVHMPHLLGYQQANAQAAELGSAIARAALARIDRPDRLVALYEQGLGTTAFRQGDNTKARKHYEEALRHLGDDDGSSLQRAVLINNLAVLRMNGGDYDAARGLYEQSLELRRGITRPGHPQIGEIYQNLSSVAAYQGDFHTAYGHLETALSIARAAEPEGGPRVMGMVVNQTHVLHQLGRDKEARASIEEALAISERLFGKGHPSNLVTWANLAAIERDSGNLQAAREAADKAMKAGVAALGPDHHDLGFLIFEQGAVAMVAGQLDEARASFNEAKTKLEKGYGSDHPQLAGILLWLARLDLQVGAMSAAAAGFERVVDIHVRRNGNQRELAQARFGLAQCLPETERTRAVSLARRARTRLVADELTDEVARIDAWLAANPP
ncbi:MAG: serine/threonine-protein kinase [Myxococcota bacterium]